VRRLGVRVLEWKFRNKRLEGYYAHDREPAVLAVQEGLSGEARRARELEAEGYHERPTAFKRREKWCFAAANVLEVDPDVVRPAGRPCIEREEPEWVERVRDEWESFWAEMPLQAKVAILLNLHERGELRVEDD
jgi:hypothetical protein